MTRFLLFAVLVSGCATPLARLKKDVGPIAADYLQCSADQLEYEELQRLIETSRVKVKGCGRSGVWQLEESQWKRDRSAQP